MSRVTALRLGKGREKRVNVYLDGAFALSLGVEVVAQEGLKVGEELTRSRIEALGIVDGSRRCLEAAMRYLSYRPRSEFELRDRLVRRGFDSAGIEAAITRLKEQGLVDDTDFARFWRDNRQSFSPRSRWLTGLELRRKGVAEEVIDRVVGEVNDDDSAYRAALSRAHRLTASDYQSFRHLLAEYLRRRGFGYRVINNTVEQLWQEIRD